MIKSLIEKIIGSTNTRTLKKTWPIVEKINKIAEEYQSTLKDQNDVLAKTSEFKERLKNGETLDQLLPEAFALVKTACVHLKGKSWPVRGKDVEWQMVPYDVQILGGIILHQGNIAEMKTGEGKTLVCTMPLYLNALTEKGVFLVTVNGYLAQRDAEWMEGLFNYLGLSVGISVTGMSNEDKKTAYSCDITYGTNNEFGFDYLRDNMATKKERIVQRNFAYAIIDEVDSILIDEARTPLIISTAAAESTEKYVRYDGLIKNLQENEDYDIDEKRKSATLTEQGIKKVENALGVDNVYTDAGFETVHHIEQALKAHGCYKKDIDYLVQDDQVIIIDQFKGRPMPGRRYSQGLHQAIEAKENVPIKRESKTLANVTFQNYFRLFEKLAGMTGTAETEAEEFYTLYGLDTIVIPTNKPIARKDRPDSIYKNERGKFTAIVRKIKEVHEKKQPILVGTISVEKSELLGRMLQKEGIPHKVLNAKFHEQEAEIVADAGKKGAVTIATNMAGRGTDIKLDAEAKAAGGLFVLGTERHESRRIDNQLRGRSGRQGDPGESQFFVSMEDSLMRLFGGEKIQNMMNFIKFPEDTPIETGIISRGIENAQKKVEGRNFDIRKHLVEYDDVMSIHRNIMYKKRREILENEDLKEKIQELFAEISSGTVRNYTEARPTDEWDYQQIWEAMTTIGKNQESLGIQETKEIKIQEKLIEKWTEYLNNLYEKIEKDLPEPELMRKIEKVVYLKTIDTLWMNHIDTMTKLRGNVAFSGYAQKNPLNEYKAQAYEKFEELNNMIIHRTVNTLFKLDPNKIVPAQVLENKEAGKIATNKDQITPNSGDILNRIAGGNNTQTRTISGNPNLVENNGQPRKVNFRGGNAEIITSATPVQNDKVGRNDSCPCGSGKKYKKCCGA